MPDIEVASWELPQPPDKPTPTRRLYASCAAEIAPEKIDWLWPGRFAMAKLSLLVGHPGVGKSQVAVAMAAAVSRGGAWPCGEGAAACGNVVFLSLEDAKPDTVIPRLAAAGADLARVHFLSDILDEAILGRRSVSLSEDLDLLELIIERIGGVRLVVLDPISSYLAGAPTSNTAATRAVLDPIAKLAYRRQVAVLGISHFSRRTSPQALDRVTGSVAFPAAARSVSMVVKDPEDEQRRLLVELKNNLGPQASALRFRIDETALPGEIAGAAVRWDDAPVSITAEQAIVVAREQEPWAKDHAKEFLLMVLGRGPVPVEQISLQARDAGYLDFNADIAQSKPFRQARNELGIKPYRVSHKFGRGQWAWTLPAVRPSS